jgi:uncharacterized protein (DUF4415 family)
MQTARKPKPTLTSFSSAQIAAAMAAAEPSPDASDIDWAQGVVTPGGGVRATIGALRKARGKNVNPTKEAVAIRLDAQVLAAFRAEGPGWQTRMNTVLKDWLAAQQHTIKPRRVSHANV